MVIPAQNDEMTNDEMGNVLSEAKCVARKTCMQEQRQYRDSCAVYVGKSSVPE